MSCGYGEKPGLLIGWAVFFVLGCAVAYMSRYHECITTNTGEKFRHLLDAVYFSLATFTTLGFGDYAPRSGDWVKLVVALEAVLGALTIGLAMVTFARKAIRD